MLWAVSVLLAVLIYDSLFCLSHMCLKIFNDLKNKRTLQILPYLSFIITDVWNLIIKKDLP